MKKRGLIIIGVVALVALGILVAVGALMGGSAQPLNEAGDRFMNAVKNHDMTSAFAMLTPDLQAKVGQVSFQDIFVDAKVDSWSFDKNAIEGDTGNLSGKATIDDKPFQVELKFVHQNDQWQITEYAFNQ